jgi:hypothetical protein
LKPKRRLIYQATLFVLVDSTKKGDVITNVTRVFFASLALAAPELHAATVLTAKLEVTPVGPTTDGMRDANGTYNVSVYARADGTPSNGDGGIALMGFDIISVDSPGNTIEPLPAGPGPQAQVVKTNFPEPGVSAFYPRRIDVGPKFDPSYVLDGDLDAFGGDLEDASFANPTRGKAGFALIATEQWQGKDPNALFYDHLRLVVSAPYYCNTPQFNSLSRFDSIIVQPFTGINAGPDGKIPVPVVPEPSPALWSLAIMSYVFKCRWKGRSSFSRAFGISNKAANAARLSLY